MEDEPFYELNLKSQKAGRPAHLKSVVQNKLYNGPRIINHLKKRDMLYLLRNIKSSQEVEDIGPLPNPNDEEDDHQDEADSV
ncbi:hypothetical protein J6590_076123 [Homalodisca vitripennis]|nr:hypothetical protein J6590_076123 [Homalodisca vitripennis]